MFYVRICVCMYVGIYVYMYVSLVCETLCEGLKGEQVDGEDYIMRINFCFDLTINCKCSSLRKKVLFYSVLFSTNLNISNVIN